jgi:hypothetical protein
MVLSSGEFDHGLRDAMLRQNVGVHGRADGWLEFLPGHKHWEGVLVEAKSGSQDSSAAIFQLKCYGSVIRPRVSRPILFLGITEKPVERSGLEKTLGELRKVQGNQAGDFWAFCSPGDLDEVLEAAGMVPPSLLVDAV